MLINELMVLFWVACFGLVILVLLLELVRFARRGLRAWLQKYIGGDRVEPD